MIEYTFENGERMFYIPYRKRFALTPSPVDAFRFAMKRVADACVTKLQEDYENLNLDSLTVVEYEFDEVH